MPFTRPRVAAYRCEGGTWLIELRLRELRQLFNTLDPAPFHEKDLDPAAEEYIVGAMREIGAHPSRIVLHLPPASTDEDAYGTYVKPMGRRTAKVVIGEPIDVKAQLGAGKARTAATELTAKLEAAIAKLEAAIAKLWSRRLFAKTPD